MATGPTLTPQTAAATFAATPTFALSRMLTSPTETLTSPFCRELFAAPAGAASPTARSAVANSAAHVFLIDSKSYLPIRVPGHAAEPLPLVLGMGRAIRDCGFKTTRKEGRLCLGSRISQGHGTQRKAPKPI